MIRKTEAIVLKTRKFQESSLLVTLFTKEYGKMNFIVQGIRSPKAMKKHSYFQPMSCIDVVMYFKETRDLQKITESALNVFFNRLQSEQTRMALGIIGTEIFDIVIRENEPNYPLYNFFKDYLLQLENQPDRLIHQFLHFLVHLSFYAGFQPRIEAKDKNAPLFFDVENGVLMNVSTGPNVDQSFFQLIESTWENCNQIQFSNASKKNSIQLMLDFYRHHTESFREPGSLKVFEDVFK